MNQDLNKIKNRKLNNTLILQDKIIMRTLSRVNLVMTKNNLKTKSKTKFLKNSKNMIRN